MSRTDMTPPSHPDHGDRPITRTDADTESETRFGPRPVPEGHRRPAGPSEWRRIPPSGEVSPDGSRSYPRPSRSAKWLVWGGTALAAAAATAGTVYAARHIAGLISGDDRDPPRRRPDAPRGYSNAPRGYSAAPRAYEDLSPRRPPVQSPHDRFQDEARPRAEARTERFQSDRSQPERARPAQKRRPNLMQEIQSNTTSLSDSVDSVMRTLTSAVAGFRGVAGQAGSIIRDFNDAAALVRSIIDAKPAARQDFAEDRTPRPAAKRPGGPARRAAAPDLHGSPVEDDPAARNPRTHRL